eukprot:TRINITY_DN22893_c0_g2_i1.p1 TRINITY_DN22893_c0_g2~~TRINITY_DN22893_c0_g2_i1.p1  ORF type:complete len:1036 (-),score=211.84 TRINITY_DN22893_c0_g2_i1:159-3266(-)
MVDATRTAGAAADVASQVVAWVCLWFLLHHVVWSTWRAASCSGAGRGASGRCWSPSRFMTLLRSAQPLERYRKRLARSQVYCFLASLGGLHLLLHRCNWTARELLYRYEREHEVFFSMAAGHWLVAIWEDAQSSKYLSAGLSGRDLLGHTASKPQEREESGAFLQRAYLLHHLAAAGLYVFVMLNRSCVGVCIFGLVFELPVLLMNHREFAVVAKFPPAWYRNQWRLDSFWDLLFFVFIVARFGPTLVYFYSLMFWWRDIFALPVYEAEVYHCGSLFFTLLNFSLLNGLLPSWRLRDEQNCTGGSLASDVIRDAAMESFRDDLSNAALGKAPFREEVPPVLLCTEEDLAGNDGSAAGSAVWLEIQGVVYDLTAFLPEHPGGADILRRHAGKDATEAFRRIGHSSAAKQQMQKFVVGPKQQPREDRYRLFSNAEALRLVAKKAVEVSVTLGGLSLCLSFTLAPALASADDAKASSELLEIRLLPIALQVAASGLLFTLLQVLRKPGELLHLYRGVNLLALACFCHLLALTMVRIPLPPDLPASCPGALELAAGFLLALEDLRERFLPEAPAARCGRPRRSRRLLPLAALPRLLASWLLRGAGLLLERGALQLAGAVLLALSTTWLLRGVRGIARSGGERERRATLAATLLRSAGMTGVVGAVFAYVLVRRSGDAGVAALERCWHQSWTSRLLSLFIGQCAILNMLQLLNSAYVFSSAWTSRALAFTFALAPALLGGLQGYRWLAVLALLLHVGDLSARNRVSLDALANSADYATMPPYRIGTQACVDQVRTTIGTFLWRYLSAPIVRVASALLPEDLVFYACEIPIFSYGENVDLGVAAYVARPRRGLPDGASFSTGASRSQAAASAEDGPGDERTPQFFSLDLEYRNGGEPSRFNEFRDLQCKLRNPPDALPGFVAAVACAFPHQRAGSGEGGGSGRLAKEVCLSAWASPEACAASGSEASSPSLPGCSRDLGGGDAQASRAHGGLHADLEPFGRIRLQDRCQRCARLVEHRQLGRAPPMRCEACNGPTFGYPPF